MSEQKVAIVTGAGSGIGTGMALVLAEHGYDVAISYRTHEGGAKEMQQKIQAMGRKCLIYKADHSTAEGCAPFVNKVRKDFGRLDAIILNAGLDCRNSILTATPEELDEVISTNYRGSLLCAGAAARHFVQDKIEGNIIFITSSRSQRAYPEDFLYGGLKAALTRSAESMALELSPYKIRVNCVAPGATARELDYDITAPPPEDLTRVEHAVPLKRKAHSKECGEAIAYLLSDNAKYITGVTLRIDGGLILSGMPEYWAAPVWLNPEWTKTHYDKVIEMSKNEEL